MSPWMGLYISPAESGFGAIGRTHNRSRRFIYKFTKFQFQFESGNEEALKGKGIWKNGGLMQYIGKLVYMRRGCNNFAHLVCNFFIYTHPQRSHSHICFIIFPRTVVLYLFWKEENQRRRQCCIFVFRFTVLCSEI